MGCRWRNFISYVIPADGNTSYTNDSRMFKPDPVGALTPEW